MIGIQGNIDSVFSCIDFYQKLSVVGSISIDDLRKSYIEMYFNDYRERYNRKQKKLSMLSKNNTSIKDTTVEVCDKEFVSNGVFLEDITDYSERSTSVITEEKKDVEYVSNGYFVDDDTECVEDKGIEENIKKDVEYSTNGVFLEDIVEVNSDDVNYSEPKKAISDDEDFSSLFDDSDEEEDDYSYLFDNDEDSESSYNLESEDDTDFEEENESEEFDFEDDVVENQEDSYSSLFDDGGNSSEEDLPVEPVRLTLPRRERIHHSRRVLNTQYGERIHKSNYTEENIEVPKTPEEKVEKKYYKNVREYVKSNPGCSTSDVKEYFSQKDIQKALISSKIVEKKGKLYVV